MTVYEELVARGLIAQVTDEDQIKELINNKELCKKFIENGNITTEKYSSDAVVEKIEEILKEHL